MTQRRIRQLFPDLDVTDADGKREFPDDTFVEITNPKLLGSEFFDATADLGPDPHVELPVDGESTEEAIAREARNHKRHRAFLDRANPALISLGRQRAASIVTAWNVRDVDGKPIGKPSEKTMGQAPKQVFDWVSGLLQEAVNPPRSQEES